MDKARRKAPSVAIYHVVDTDIVRGGFSYARDGATPNLTWDTEAIFSARLLSEAAFFWSVNSLPTISPGGFCFSRVCKKVNQLFIAIVNFKTWVMFYSVLFILPMYILNNVHCDF